MANTSLISTKYLQEISRKLPVKADVIKMQECADFLLVKGMVRLEEMIESDIANPDQKIKAMNTIISCGKYLESRKMHEQNQPSKLIIDTQYKIVNDSK